MRPIAHALSLAAVMSFLSAAAPPLLAAEPTEHDHTHAAAPSSAQPDSAATTQTMQNMQAMHEKMMAAKTPAERQALMADHMKAMQEGMTMMQQMCPCTQAGKATTSGAMSSKMMQMRMNMMTMMMQMMMDRQQMGGMPMGAPPAAPNK